MLVPGSNLLSMALRVIAPQGVQWRAWVSETRLANGNLSNVYATAVAIEGSLQPVSLTLVQTLGLDLSQSYMMLYTSAAVKALQRDRAADIVSYGGSWYQIENQIDWHTQDGWSAYLCIRTGPA